MVKCYLLWIVTVVCFGSTFCLRRSEDIAAVKKYIAELDSAIQEKQHGWKEPNDMFSYHREVDERLNSEENQGTSNLNKEMALSQQEKRPKDCSEVCESEINETHRKDNVYLMRWLKMFLNRFSDTSLVGENKLISFPMDSFSLDKIRSMLEAKSFNVALMDNIMSQMMAEATVTEQGSWIMRIITVLLNNRVFLITSISLAIGFAIFQHPRLFIAILVILVCLSWQWGLLYHKEISKKHAKLESIGYPEVCQSHKFGIFDAARFFIKGLFISQGTCEDYYQALMVDPFWEVTPATVISAAMLTFVTHPIKTLFETLNASILILFKDFSIFHKIVVVVFFFLLLMMIFNYRLRMPLFLSFEPSYPPISPATANQVQTTSYLSNIFQSLKSVCSRFTNGQEIRSLTSSNDMSELSTNQESQVSGTSYSQINSTGGENEYSLHKGHQVLEASPTAKPKLCGFIESSDHKETESNVCAKVKSVGFWQSSIEKEGVNNTKYLLSSHSFSEPQLPILDSAGTEIACTKIQNQGVEMDTDTGMNNMETEVKEMDIKEHDMKTEVKEMDIKEHDMKTEVKEMDIKEHDMKTEVKEMDIKEHDMKTEVSDGKTEVTDTKTEVTDTKTEVTDTKTEVTDTKTEVTDTKTEVTDTKTEVNEMHMKVDYSEAGVKEMDIEVNMKTEVNGMCMKVNYTEAIVKEMDIEVNDVKTEASEMDMVVNDMETEEEISCRKKGSEIKMEDLKSELEGSLEFITDEMGDGNEISTKSPAFLQYPLTLKLSEVELEASELLSNGLRKLSL